jgi:cell division protease FtsH
MLKRLLVAAGLLVLAVPAFAADDVASKSETSSAVDAAKPVEKDFKITKVDVKNGNKPSVDVTVRVVEEPSTRQQLLTPFGVVTVDTKPVAQGKKEDGSKPVDKVKPSEESRIKLMPWSRYTVDEISWTEAQTLIDENKVTDVSYRSSPDSITYFRDTDGKLVRSNYYLTSVEMNKLKEHGVRISIDYGPDIIQVAITIFMLFFNLLIFGFMLVMISQQISMFFDNPAKRGNKKGKDKVTFADVAGIDEAKAEVQEVVDYLKDPKKYKEAGATPIKGVLMSGDPGNGKTLLAKAIAGEADVPFYFISGAEFVEMFVGLGARRVRKMFSVARKAAKSNKHKACILFIDEIDAVGGKREGGGHGGHQEREQTLNQMLVEMDGMNDGYNIVVVAATNRPEMLDEALLRPGRFDRHVTIHRPGIDGRKAILEVHARKFKLAEDVDLGEVAQMTPGYSGADLAHLLNEAAHHAARVGKKGIDRECVHAARDKKLLGEERPGAVMSEEERKVAAYHEAGHALVAMLAEGSDPVHKISVVPRRHALGVVVRLPERDRALVSRKKLMADLAVAMGGRAAEELVFGSDVVSTGAVADIEHATKLCREMAGRWGMFDELGKKCYLGSNPYARDVADATMARLDDVVRIKLDDAYSRAIEMIAANRHTLELLVDLLLDKGTIDGSEAYALLKQVAPSEVGDSAELAVAACHSVQDGE